MRTFVAAIFLALVAGPAFAQIGSFNLLPEDQKKTPEEIQRGEVPGQTRVARARLRAQKSRRAPAQAANRIRSGFVYSGR